MRTGRRTCQGKGNPWKHAIHFRNAGFAAVKHKKRGRGEGPIEMIFVPSGFRAKARKMGGRGRTVCACNVRFRMKEKREEEGGVRFVTYEGIFVEAKLDANGRVADTPGNASNRRGGRGSSGGGVGRSIIQLRKLEGAQIENYNQYPSNREVTGPPTVRKKSN